MDWIADDSLPSEGVVHASLWPCLSLIIFSQKWPNLKSKNLPILSSFKEPKERWKKNPLSPSLHICFLIIPVFSPCPTAPGWLTVFFKVTDWLEAPCVPPPSRDPPPRVQAKVPTLTGAERFEAFFQGILPWKSEWLTGRRPDPPGGGYRPFWPFFLEWLTGFSKWKVTHPPMVKKRYVSDIACAWLIGARDSRMNQLIDSNLDIYLQLVCRYALPLVLPGFVFSGQRNWGHANHMQCHDWEHYQVHEITLWRWSSPQKVQVAVQGNLMFRFYFSFFSQHQEAIIRTENLALKTELARHNEALV